MIKCSAILLPNGKIYSGYRHSDCFAQIPDDETRFGEVQGFITDKNLFVNRQMALQIAIDCKQVVEGKTISPSMLYSEDLYTNHK